MSAHDNGGPAFPQSETLSEDGAVLVREAHGGMSLRAWLTGQALAGILANPQVKPIGMSSIGDLREEARQAVSAADATLAELAKAERQP